MNQDYVVAYCRWGKNILVVHKDRPEWMKGRINLPGGKIDPGDSDPIAAAVRELKEESGYDPSNLLAYPSNEVGLIQTNKSKIHVVEILGPRSEDAINPRPGETEVVQWMNYFSLMSDHRLMPNLRVIIPLLIAGVHGWIIQDDGSSWGKQSHTISVQIPTHLKVTTNKD